VRAFVEVTVPKIWGVWTRYIGRGQSTGIECQAWYRSNRNTSPGLQRAGKGYHIQYACGSPCIHDDVIMVHYKQLHTSYCTWRDGSKAKNSIVNIVMQQGW